MQTTADRSISLSYVLPEFNEAEILDDTIRIFVTELTALAPLVRDFELIVVDDASTDDSAAIAAAWAARDPRVRLVRRERNAGVGVAILAGLTAATKEWVSVNCADRPFNVRDVAKLGPLFEHHDCIVVARQDRSANPLYRKLTSWTNYTLIRTLFRIPVSDYQFTQFYRVAALEGVTIRSRGTLVPPELIYSMWKRGARLAQVTLPFYSRPGGSAKYGHPKYALHTLWEMAQLRLVTWRDDWTAAPTGYSVREVSGS